LRGGSWNNHLDNARVADRNNNNPDNDWNNNGFRVAAHISPAGSACQSRLAVEAKWRTLGLLAPLSTEPGEYRKAPPVPGQVQVGQPGSFAAQSPLDVITFFH
jgi:hypothetical protein